MILSPVFGNQKQVLASIFEHSFLNSILYDEEICDIECQSLSKGSSFIYRISTLKGTASLRNGDEALIPTEALKTRILGLHLSFNPYLVSPNPLLFPWFLRYK